MMPNRSLPLSWALAPLAAGAVLLANVALASNHHYDENVTTGGLQKVCKDFSIDRSDILRATCNKSTAGIISQVKASVDLKPDMSDSCQGHIDDYIDIRHDSVVITYKCPASTGDKKFELDLNVMVSWDASTGKLSLKNA